MAVAVDWEALNGDFEDEVWVAAASYVEVAVADDAWVVFNGCCRVNVDALSACRVHAGVDVAVV